MTSQQSAADRLPLKQDPTGTCEKTEKALKPHFRRIKAMEHSTNKLKENLNSTEFMQKTLRSANNKLG